MSPAAIAWDRSEVLARAEVTPAGCWLWKRRQRDGYALITSRGVCTVAHRFVYELLVGPVPEGLVLDHTCHSDSECPGGVDCPHRACVNPEHLEPVTPRENYERGRHYERVAATTHCPQGHPYEGRNLIHYGGRRYCRACMYERRDAARRAS